MSETVATTDPKAISTYKVFLMRKGSSETWNKVLDIKDFPDLGGAPELLETTTLSDKMKTYIPGIQSQDALTFTANYSQTAYEAIKTLENNQQDYEFAVWFGGTESNGEATPTGVYGKFELSGRISAYVNGGGVNEVVGMTVTIAPSTPITFTAGG